MANESATNYQPYEYDSIPQGGIASNISLRVESTNIPNSFVLNRGNVTCNVFFMNTYFNNIVPRQFSFNIFVDSNPSLIITTNAPNPGFNMAPPTQDSAMSEYFKTYFNIGIFF
jgi:hypothetical protein